MGRLGNSAAVAPGLAGQEGDGHYTGWAPTEWAGEGQDDKKEESRRDPLTNPVVTKKTAVAVFFVSTRCLLARKT